jgi:hypothetical protein
MLWYMLVFIYTLRLLRPFRTMVHLSALSHSSDYISLIFAQQLSNDQHTK